LRKQTRFKHPFHSFGVSSPIVSLYTSKTRTISNTALSSTSVTRTLHFRHFRHFTALHSTSSTTSRPPRRTHQELHGGDSWDADSRVLAPAVLTGTIYSVGWGGRRGEEGTGIGYSGALSKGNCVPQLPPPFPLCSTMLYCATKSSISWIPTLLHVRALFPLSSESPRIPSTIGNFSIL